MYRYVKLFRDYGNVVPAARRNGPSHLVGEQEATVLLRIILENPGIYLHEMQEELFSNCGVWLHPSTICKALHRTDKESSIALQRSEQCRARFMAEVSLYDPKMFVWIDETGCDKRNSQRKHAYSMIIIIIVD